jgi:hypothetical protein
MTMVNLHETLGGEQIDEPAAQTSRSFFIDPELQVWPQSAYDDLIINSFAFHGACEDVLVRPLSLVAYSGVTATGELVSPNESSRNGAEHTIAEIRMLAFDNSPSPWPSTGGWQLHKAKHNRRFDDMDTVVAKTYGLFITEEGSYMLAREQDMQGRLRPTKVVTDSDEFLGVCAEIDMLLTRTETNGQAAYEAAADRLRAAYHADQAEYDRLRARTTPNDSGTRARREFEEFVEAKHIGPAGAVPVVGFPPAPWQPVTLPHAVQ